MSRVSSNDPLQNGLTVRCMNKSQTSRGVRHTSALCVQRVGKTHAFPVTRENKWANDVHLAYVT